MEIRIGNEHISSFAKEAKPLSDRNELCGKIEFLSSSTFTIECQKSLVGRYLSIQLLSYGQIHLDEVKVEPESGVYVWLLRWYEGK